MDFEFGEYKPTCPWCKTGFPSSEPRPSCNECECCFCSIECRDAFHASNALAHDYDKPLPDYGDQDNA